MRSSASVAFDYNRDCVFCGFSDPYDGKKTEFALIQVRTLELRQAILQACDEYDNEWVKEVKPRFLFASDLPAADVVYHHQCSVNFRTGKAMPLIFATRQKGEIRTGKRAKLGFRGRPIDEIRRKAFLDIVERLKENDDEQTTVVDLVEDMRMKV